MLANVHTRTMTPGHKIVTFCFTTPAQSLNSVGLPPQEGGDIQIVQILVLQIFR